MEKILKNTKYNVSCLVACIVCTGLYALFTRKLSVGEVFGLGLTVWVAYIGITIVADIVFDFIEEWDVKEIFRRKKG